MRRFWASVACTKRFIDLRNLARRRRVADGFDHVKQTPCITVGRTDHQFACFFGERQCGKGLGERASEQFRQVLVGERLEYVDRRTRQQRAVDFERRIFGGRADESHQSALDERQERVLLRLVEAVDFVDEQDGRAPGLLEHVLGMRDGIADILDAGKNRRERNELGIEGLRHESRQRGFAHARRTPQDHRMQLSRLVGDAQRLVGTEQMPLADDFVQTLRPHQLRKRRRRLPRFEQISHLDNSHRRGAEDAEENAR